MIRATVFGHWLLEAYKNSLRLFPVCICEFFARPRYEVVSVCGYVSYGDIENNEKSQKAVEGKSETTEKETNKPGMFESMWGSGISSIFAF